MNPMTRLAAVAAVLAVAVGAAYLLSRPVSNIGPQGSQLPTASPAAPSPRPTVAPRVTVTDVGRTLSPGSYHTDGFPMDFTFTVPVGWNVSEFTANSFGLAETSDASVNIGFLRLAKVYGDPCHTGDGPKAITPGADALVAAFAAMPNFSIDNLKDTTLGGAAAKTFLFGNDIDVAAAGCSGTMLPFGTRIDGLGHDVDVAMFGGEFDQFWVLDFGGRGTILVAVTDTRVPMVQGVLDSLKFDGPASVGEAPRSSPGGVAADPTDAAALIPTGTSEREVPVSEIEAGIANALFNDQERHVITDTLALRDASSITIRLVISSGAITIQHAVNGGSFSAAGTWPTPSMDNGSLGIKYNPSVLGHVFSYSVTWNTDGSAFRLGGGGSSPELDAVARILFAELVMGEFARVG